MRETKAVRIKYKTKDGECKLTGLIKKTEATDELLEFAKKKYGNACYVDLDEEY